MTKSGTLTSREVEVLTLLAQGHTARDAAVRLYMSPWTVKVHIRNVLKKFGARNTAQAVAIGITCGHISYPAQVTT